MSDEERTVDEAEDLQEKKNEVIEDLMEEAETTASDGLDAVEVRKKALKDGLLGSAEEKLDGEAQVEKEKLPPRKDPPTPSTEANFDRKGAAIAGPFARKRLRPVENNSKPATPDNPRRGVQRIWKDRPINNV